MSVYAVLSRLQANALPYCEYVISTSADLALISGCAPGSVATLPNGLRYILSADGEWRFDYGQPGWALEATGDVAHQLNLTEGDNSSLAVAVGATSKADGDDVFYGESLTVTYSGDTGYTATCVINGAAAGESPVTYPVPLGDDVTIVTAATLNTYELTLTTGENTTLTVVDAAENEYNDGDMVPHGTVLTITAAAAEGYDLTTFTVGGVDKIASNPDEHTMAAALTIVTAATEQ